MQNPMRATHAWWNDRIVDPIADAFARLNAQATVELALTEREAGPR